MAGADKAIRFDPPGAIGLVDREATFLIRFEEIEDADRPKDSAGKCDDFEQLIDVTTTMPEIVNGVLGRAREFDGASHGLAARDTVAGATLLTRDMSIQVVMLWDVGLQDSAGTPGTIIARGLGGSAAERVAFGLQLDVVDVPTHTAHLRWFWEDVAGVAKLQDGADVVLPPGQFTMLTATRRWVSPTEVELRYYVGDQLLGIVTSVDGSIGGGTTGALQLGYRRVAATPDNFLAGVLDELLVVDRELCLEEVEATWLRITLYQPLGVQLFKEMMDPGFPITDEPDSDAQLEIRMVGQALGYAAAQVENLRANFLPGRSYGSTLEQWEEAVRATPKPASSIEERRLRVLARLAQRRGISIPGLDDALEGLIGEATVDDLEFLAFDQTIRDDFATLEAMRWDVAPAASWTAPAGTARSSPGAGSYVFNGHGGGWRYARMSVGGKAKRAHVLAKVTMTTPQANLETGVFFGQWTAHNYLLLGLRDNAGSFEAVSQRYIGGVAQAVVVEHVFGANPANLWLHLYQTDVDGTWKAAWSTTSGTTGFTVGADITHPTSAHWAGMYVRSTAAIAGAGQVDVDDLVMRAPFGNRPFNAYVFLDSALGFSPDIAGAQSVIAAIKHGFTHATFITSKNLLCDNVESGCDLGPMGGI